MRSHRTVGLVVAVMALATATPSFALVVFYDWQPTDAQTWNDNLNWNHETGTFVPDADTYAGESARINSGGTAIVAEIVPRVAEISVTNGTIEIEGGGQLEAIVDGSGGTGSLAIGGAGAVNLSGNGQLTIGGNVTNSGTLRLTGPSALFSVNNNFSTTGTLVADITDATNHSVVSVAGNATVGGTLNVDFNGVSPSVGDTWNLIDAAAISGGYQNFNVTGDVSPGMGMFFQIQSGGFNGTLGQVAADVQLVLSVNSRTGATSIQNLIAGEDVQLDGYLIKSQADVLNPDAWTSFRDAGNTDWTESNPTGKHLGELNLSGSGVVTGASSASLGAIYDFSPTMIGELEPNLVFEYRVPGDETRLGQVEFVGPRNNVVLLVDPETGAAAIQNQSIFDIEFDGYLVKSDSSALDPAGWDSLTTSLAGWTESNQAANHIGELNLEGALSLPAGSDPISLGSLFDFDGTDVEQDLDFVFHVAGSDGGVLTADFDDNQVVNDADLTIWENNFGTAGDATMGDANGDGIVDGSDFLEWQRQVGRAGGMGGGSIPGIVQYGSFSLTTAASAVPEPASIGLLMAACASAIGSRWRIKSA